MTTLAIRHSPDSKITTEIIAENILLISEGVKRLRQGPLNDRALVLLIQNAAPSVGGSYSTKKIGSTEVRAVLQGIEQLEKTYLKPKTNTQGKHTVK